LVASAVGCAIMQAWRKRTHHVRPP
jgi:hypothetical protein